MSSWGGGTQFSKLPYVGDFLNMWCQKLSFFIRVSSSIMKIHSFFRKISKTCFAAQNPILKFASETHVHGVILKIVLALTNFTSNRDSVPSGSRSDLHDEARRAEFTKCWMGWDGMGYGMDRNQKCPSIFFILCTYI